MTLQHVDYVFQLIAFLFAISFHESAHAWMANRCGDPTARMLGRISLNPIKHIDPVGTVILPLIAMITGLPMLGWAKPTPVNPLNFRNKVLDDIKTSVVGPISNFVIVLGALSVLVLIAMTSHSGARIVGMIPSVYPYRLEELAGPSDSLLLPLSLMAYDFLAINVMLAVFNLIPVPPLDGSHVLRHALPEPILKVYDSVGWLGLVALVYLGRNFNLLGRLIWPVLGFFDSILILVTRSR